MSLLNDRKRLLASLLVVVTLLSGVAVTGILFAQSGDYSQVLDIAPDDSDIVAVVDGLDVTRRDLRLVPDSLMVRDPSLSEADAVARSIVSAIGIFIMQAEVERRGLVPTLAETEEFRKPYKESCDGAECREYLQRMGFEDYDEAWADALPGYRQDLGKIRVIQEMLGEKGLLIEQGGTHEQALQARSDFGAELRANVNIVWHDKGLEEQYNQALKELNFN